MKSFNRRQWLRTAGLTGAISMIGGLNSLSATSGRAIRDNVLEPGAPVRLTSNENPFGPSERVREAMINAFDKGCRYPWRFASELAEKIAAKEGLTTDHIVITAGSTEGLKDTGLTLGLYGGEIITAEPTFKALTTYAEQFGAYINSVSLDDQLGYDLDEIEKRITHQTRLVFICNPNNPTGTILPARKLRDFCESVSRKTVVFSDEAYYDYISEPNYPSMTELVKQGQNVIVSKTFSKVYGLAGIRIGYLIARPDMAARLRQNRMAGPNILAIYAAKAALEDEDFYRFSLQRNKEAKNHIYQTLKELSLPFVTSHTNFVFFQSGREISSLSKDMADRGVLVGRPFPPLNQWCRISTGTMEEVRAFGMALHQVYG